VFGCDRIQSGIVNLVSTHSIDFDSVSAIVELENYEPSAMGIQLTFGFIPANGATVVRFFAAICCIPVAVLIWSRFEWVHNPAEFMDGLFCLCAINPLYLCIEQTAKGLAIDKCLAVALRHFFRQFLLWIFRTVLKKDDVYSRRMARNLSWSFWPFLFVDLLATLHGLSEMGNNRTFAKHMSLFGKVSLVGEIWFCCICIFAANGNLSLLLQQHQKSVLSAAVFQTVLHAILNIAMFLNHEFLPCSAELLGTAMYIVHGLILLWMFRPRCGFDLAQFHFSQYAQCCSD
jgi:hypothetical protein